MDNTVSEYSHVTSCITQNHSVIKHGYFKTKQKKKKITSFYWRVIFCLSEIKL